MAKQEKALKSFIQVAYIARLTGFTRLRFLLYMYMRYSLREDVMSDSGEAFVIANSFKQGTEAGSMDDVGRKVLERIDFE
jgi:hypothetical protein